MSQFVMSFKIIYS